MKEQILTSAKELQPMLLDIRRDLHRHPETGFDLTYTKEKVRKELIDMGYAPIDCGKAGLVALVGGKQPGKTIMLRADMDALLAGRAQMIRVRHNSQFLSHNTHIPECQKQQRHQNSGEMQFPQRRAETVDGRRCHQQERGHQT